MIDDDELPNNLRPDLSPYLIHLTKKHNNRSGLINLLNILEEGIIDGSDSFVFGRRKAACFMDVPFVALKHICSSGNNKRYEPYGLIVKKTTAYRKGARPVLYLSKKERETIGLGRSAARDELWRVVSLEGSNEKDIWGVNWTHEREWRSPDEFRLPPTIYAVLVRNSNEASKVMAMLVKKPDMFSCTPRSVIPLNVICQGLI